MCGWPTKPNNLAWPTICCQIKGYKQTWVEDIVMCERGSGEAFDFTWNVVYQGVLNVYTTQRATELVRNNLLHINMLSGEAPSGGSLPLIFCIHVRSGPIYWGSYLSCKKDYKVMVFYM